MLRLWRRDSAAKISSVAPHLVYAVGDVHGRSDLIDPLLAKIREDARQIPTKPKLIFLGDYVDRGPDARGVIEQLIALQSEPTFELVALKGNHEHVLLRFLEDADLGATWNSYGGRETLLAYGVEPAQPGRTWLEVQQELLNTLPANHIDFLKSLPLLKTLGDYVFVHAGIRPGVPLARQVEKDLLWIREPFLSHRAPCDQVVVHGHTPAGQVEMMGCRIGVDTGAYHTGVLTAVRLFGIDRRILQVRG